MVNNEEKFASKIENKSFLIDKFQESYKQAGKKNAHKKPKKFTLQSSFQRQLKSQMKIFNLKGESLQFDVFQPMNTLWKSYIQSVIGNDTNKESQYQKILRADLHGSFIQILNSKCQSYEGQSGIVIQEGLKSFTLITKQNRVIKIIKQNSIFLVEAPPGNYLKIYGCHLQIRPAERVRTKFHLKLASKYILENV